MEFLYIAIVTFYYPHRRETPELEKEFLLVAENPRDALVNALKILTNRNVIFVEIYQTTINNPYKTLVCKWENMQLVAIMAQFNSMDFILSQPKRWVITDPEFHHFFIEYMI